MIIPEIGELIITSLFTNLAFFISKFSNLLFALSYKFLFKSFAILISAFIDSIFQTVIYLICFLKQLVNQKIIIESNGKLRRISFTLIIQLFQFILNFITIFIGLSMRFFSQKIDYRQMIVYIILLIYMITLIPFFYLRFFFKI